MKRMIPGLLLAWTLQAAPLQLYVAIGGSDASSGKSQTVGKDGPFASIERARMEVRALKEKGALLEGGVVVNLGAGTWRFSQATGFTDKDSGTEKSPVVWQAQAGATVRFSGAVKITGFEKTSSKSILDRLSGEAQKKVWQADLKAQGITNFGIIGTSVRQDRNPPLDLTLDGNPATLARWPNDGFEWIAGAPAGEKGGMFSYMGDRPLRWAAENDARANGYWDFDWHSSHVAFDSIDGDKRVIKTKAPHAVYGYRKGGRWYAYNLLSEIDQPGEWYLDRTTGILYLWPPADPSKMEIEASVAGAALTVENASDLVFRGITFEGFRNDAVSVRGSSRVVFAACTFRNLGRKAASVEGGSNIAFRGCDFTDLGEGGVTMNGGDRLTLTPAGHVVENCVFTRVSRWQRTYTPAISLSGTGMRASRNLCFDNPGVNVWFTGNDHLIELNEVHSMGWEGGEMGAFYCGRNWTLSGNLLRWNYVHDIYNPCPQRNRAFMLDDGAAGITMVGNVFVRIAEGISLSSHMNHIRGNLFVDCYPAVGAWGGVEKFPEFDLKAGHNGFMWPRLAELPLDKAPWSVRFPELLQFRDAVSNGLTVPQACRARVESNVVWKGSPEWLGWNVTKDKSAWLVRDNFSGIDPMFENPAANDWRLKADSPILKKGFSRIPMEKIGVYRDADRASWPVKNEVRTNVCRNFTYVPPPAPPRLTIPRLKAPRITKRPNIDGMLDDGEWTTGETSLEENVTGEVTFSPSRAWMGWDDEALYVAFRNPVNAITPMALDNVWGKNEAVEIALRKVGDKGGATVLRGFAKGTFVAIGDAGASDEAVRRATEGVQFAAKPQGAALWTCEWRIPFSSLGINPKTERSFDMNLTVRKVADGLWIMWVGTGSRSYEVDKAGRLSLVDSVVPPLVLDDAEGDLKWTGAAEKSASNARGKASVRYDASTSLKGISLRGFPSNLAAYEALAFDAFSERATGAPIEVLFFSPPKTGTVNAYYRHTMKVDWMGWKTMEIPFASFMASRDPVGFSNITGFDFSTRGWGHETNVPGTILYIDNFMVK